MYDVDKLNGSVETTSTSMMLPMQWIVSQKSYQQDDHYYNMSKHDDRLAEELPVRETFDWQDGNKFINRQVQFPQQVDVVETVRISGTISFPGSVDSYGIPMKRYTGGIDSEEVFMFFDLPLQLKGFGGNKKILTISLNWNGRMLIELTYRTRKIA